MPSVFSLRPKAVVKISVPAVADIACLLGLTLVTQGTVNSVQRGSPAKTAHQFTNIGAHIPDTVRARGFQTKLNQTGKYFK